MSVYADGGRIGFASGTPDPGMMQGLGALRGQQKQNTNTKIIDMMPDIQILTGSENTIDAQQVFPNDIAIAIGDSNNGSTVHRVYIIIYNSIYIYIYIFIHTICRRAAAKSG